MANQRRASGSRSKKGQVAQAPPVDFRTEYHYVLNDLKRLGIVAASLFAVLIVLAIVL